MKKHKLASMSLTVRDRAISSKFSTHRVSQETTLCKFQKKKNPLPKNSGHFEFSNFCQKCKKHKCASVSLTMQDRAILLKFSTYMVSKQSTPANFQKFFLSLKMMAILNFRVFTENGKTHIGFYLLNRAR